MASNAAALAALDAYVRKLRSVDGLAVAAAPAVAEAFKEELDGQIARGQGPDGTPWQRTESGEQPLQNAAAAVTVKAVGSVIVARVEGPEAFHHRGQTRGNIRRQILPSAALPQPFTRAIKRVLEERFAEVMGHGR